MSNIKLKYGKSDFSFHYAEDRFSVLENVNAASEQALSDVEIGAELDQPIDSQPLEEIISPNETVLVVVSDATRQTGSATVVNLLVRRLIQLGVAPYDLRIIFATGIHRKVTPVEKENLLTSFITQRIKILDHNARDTAQHVSFGMTTRGTPIELNRALTEHDHIILTGAVGFHYFAGFTGGRKSICPGLASERTIAATHLLALDFEQGGKRRAGVGAGRLDGNLVHEECERIAAEIAPSFLINTVTNERGGIMRVYCGDWRAAHRRACAEYADEHVARINGKRSVVIVSCGGTPYDVNLIQAHKALEMGALACAEGGEIVLLAECAEGFGRDDFLKWFDAKDSNELGARLRESYEVTGQTAWALMTKTERFRVHLVSNLNDEDVRRMNMFPARTLDEAMQRVDSTAAGYVMPRGAALMPFVREGENTDV
ncbi:MAG: nickel-dependent lactate racemase [Pyrinomonadaceae bacterium]|nr:nickel-dependent lactate racemase [Pyrinomonadaceae bacterium]